MLFKTLPLGQMSTSRCRSRRAWPVRAVRCPLRRKKGVRLPLLRGDPESTMLREGSADTRPHRV